MNSLALVESNVESNAERNAAAPILKFSSVSPLFGNFACLALALSGSLVLALALFSQAPVAAAGPGGDETFRGEIADSQCALNVHSLTQSHKEMLVGKTVGSTNADCVWYCVKERGGRFVLQDKAKVYRLDLQNIGKEYAGRKVKVTGTLDPKTSTIHVKSIELADDSSDSASK
jgi:Protein of unknown function (DUF5818)